LFFFLFSLINVFCFFFFVLINECFFGPFDLFINNLIASVRSDI
jgi:hypothetical protein